MILTLRNKEDIDICEVKEFTYSNIFMGENKITATIYSADKLNIGVDSYVMFKGVKYSIFKNVTGTKTSTTSMGIGDAMKYDLELFSPIKVLEKINFEDYVSKDDTEVYYTGTPVFDFYNNVTELAIRLQANLDRFLGENEWNITVDPNITLEEKQVSVSNINLRDGLMMVSSVYGLNWYVTNNNIIIGGDGVKITPTLYYGKNKGLYEISRVFDSNNKIITRLKAYGSNRNLPSDYLREENGKGRYFTQLMLPDFATTGIDYVDAPQELIDEYGIREGSKIFDDVYPSIEGVDLGHGRIDEIFKVYTIDENSDTFQIKTRNLKFDINEYILPSDTPRISIKGTNSDGSPTHLGGYEFEITKVEGRILTLKKNQADNIVLPDNVTTVRSGDYFVLLGIRMPDIYISNSENKLKTRAEAYISNGEGSVELSYLIKLDEIFIEKNNIGDSFDAGKKLRIEDADLDVANYFTIQNMTVKYGGKIIPQYDIKLSNIKSKTLKDEIREDSIKQSNINTTIKNFTSFTVNNQNIDNKQIVEDLKWE